MPPASVDPLLVGAALGVQILGDAVGHVRAREVDVDMAEKILRHEMPIGLRMVAGEADVFVEVERRDVPEAQAPRCGAGG